MKRYYLGVAFQAKRGGWGFNAPGLCPGLLPLRLWRLPDALSHNGSWQTDVAAGDVIGPSRW